MQSSPRCPGPLRLSYVRALRVLPFPGPFFPPPHGPLHFIEGSRLLNFLPFSNNISVPRVSLRNTPHPTQDPTRDHYLIYNLTRASEFPPVQSLPLLIVVVVIVVVAYLRTRVFKIPYTPENERSLCAYRAVSPLKDLPNDARRRSMTWGGRIREKRTVSGN